MEVHIFQLRDCQAVVRHWIKIYDNEGFAWASNEYLACIIRFHLVHLDDELIKRIRKLEEENRRTCKWTLKPVQSVVLLFCYAVLGIENDLDTLQVRMFFGALHQSNPQDSIWRKKFLHGSSLSG